MSSIAYSVTCIAVLAYLGVASPTPMLSLRGSELAKRAPSGPENGGANFPDPSITKSGSTWYSFGTSSGVNIQVASSPDFNTWSYVKNSDGSPMDALPNLPAWINTQAPATWAPDVSQLDDGSWIMYFTAATQQDGAHHCIGAATSSDVVGPYTAGADPLVCDLSTGGQIDPAGFVENGQRYVLWKVDGNSDPSSDGQSGTCGSTDNATPLMIQPVAADGVTLQGSPSALLNNCNYNGDCASGTSDDGIVEAPSLVNVDGTYVLFFSSGCFATENYKVQYATSSSLFGPYSRSSNPLFQTGTDGLSGPGGASIFSDGQHLVFHANDNGGRALYTDLVTISGTSVMA